LAVLRPARGSFRRLPEGGMTSSVVQDVAAPAALLVLMVLCRRNYWFRGTTYRATVLSGGQERVLKLALYITLLGTIDLVLRRLGQLLAFVGLMPAVGSSLTCVAARVVLLHGPFLLWAAMGPLSLAGSTRDDRGWSEAATKADLWKWLATVVFKGSRIVLSDEWLQLSTQERDRLRSKRQYIVGLHPHGLMPVGAIINGLTWAGGGCHGLTASGAELPEPEDAGPGLHQRWFPHMRLRAAVASGACGVFPGAYEMFRKLGAFECTKAFVQSVLREGKSVAIFPGGAQESVYATPGRYVCLASQHKGFVRLALEERLDILPMWTFGDESVAPQLPDAPPAIVAAQRWLKEVTGILIPPAFAGLPRCPPLTLVTGVPVTLDDLWPDEPAGQVSDAAVEEGHRRYIEAQRKLFETNKALVPGGHAKAVIEFR